MRGWHIQCVNISLSFLDLKVGAKAFRSGHLGGWGWGACLPQWMKVMVKTRR